MNETRIAVLGEQATSRLERREQELEAARAAYLRLIAPRYAPIARYDRAVKLVLQAQALIEHLQGL